MVFNLFRKKIFWLIFLIIVALVTLFFYPQTVLTPAHNIKNYFQPPTYEGPLVQINNVSIPVELATSTEAVTKGLSGRPSLDADKGMLFIFDLPYQYRFWMPEMNFPLDMIWIENGRIADITENATENFDPLAPVFYQPIVPVRYVLEVNAGFVQKYNLKIGDQVALVNID
ncbi:MAG: DUF192 domain-containing protein [Candidatus Paceibacterota bacterium]|jgi:uncharacterized membrane protein (UPF0127 family)